MKRLWQFFWFVVACFVAGSIMIDMAQPYMETIVAVVVLVALAYIGFKVYATMTSRRRHF